MSSKFENEKQLVALSSVVAAVFLTFFKLIVGIATNSIGILAEALHSALDLVAAAMTLWAVRASGQPADEVHTYGHGKFENLSALVETVLLLVTCVWIVYESVRRLLHPGLEVVELSVWAFIVVGLSMVIDFGRSRALRHAAIKYQSQALEADALHFSTDLYASAVVFVGLGLVWISQHHSIPWLAQADAVAALGVAAISVWISLKLGKRSVEDLLDAVPADLQERVRATVAGVSGVQNVRQVRVRKSGPEFFADVILSVGRGTAIEDAHDISDRVEEAVKDLTANMDVVVHVEPEDGAPGTA